MEYKGTKFEWEQMREILEGYKNGLSDAQVGGEK